MNVDDIAYTSAPGSARLYAVELGVLDFRRKLCDAELAVLLLVDHLSAHGLDMPRICAIMRWLSARLPRLDMSLKLPQILTLLDYRYVVVSFDKRGGYCLSTCAELPLHVISTHSCAVSTAFVLPAILQRKAAAIDALKSAARFETSSLVPALTS